eukprot:Nitzschia sp. Nitz4//scaffold25_size161228//100927//103578//NITZ4_002441-RA/size161228-augustus-gene-0.132-mRNA-1//-1//CDS//3329544619//2955//frame0
MIHIVRSTSRLLLAQRHLFETLRLSELLFARDEAFLLLANLFGTLKRGTETLSYSDAKITMTSIFKICCGDEEEERKFSDSWFLDPEDDDFPTESLNSSNRSSAREKAAVALELKRGGMRASIFSCPIDVVSHWEPPTYEKSESDRDFLQEILKSHLLFEELSDTELSLLVDAMEPLQLTEGEQIVQQNERGEYLYVVQSGQFDIYCEVAKRSCGQASRGDIFGELALLYGEEYPKSVITVKDALVWRIEQETFRNVLARHARMQDQDILSSLKKVDLFASLTSTTLQKLAEGLTRVHFSKGAHIVRRGDKGEVFYIIESGSVRVHNIGMGDSKSVEHVLSEGDSFGERSLLTGEPRAASITAIDDVTTLSIDRATFENYMGDIKELMAHKAIIQSLRSLPALAGADLSKGEYDRLADCVNEICFSKGTKLIKFGQPTPRTVWFIRKGQLIVYGDESESLLNLLPGDYFGEASLFDAPDKPSKYEAICEENVSAWVLKREDLERVVVDLQRLGKTGGFTQKKRAKPAIRSVKDLALNKVVGKGGFGVVWQATSKATGNIYALKVINKRKLLESKQERSVLREKDLLSLLHHPFILRLEASFQDAHNLYLVLPLIRGGELFSLVAARARVGQGLVNRQASFYALCIVEALGHFHHRYIAYRDLKLENVMIDSQGYPHIVDLGFAKVIMEKSYTFCGTPDYLAPEIIMARGHNHAVDYWAYGVLLHEMLAGRAPFQKPKQSQMDMFKRIVMMDYSCSDLISIPAQDLITNLLVRQVSKRLGTGNQGHTEIVEHPWFRQSKIDVAALVRKEVDAPWIPMTSNPTDSPNPVNVEMNSSKGKPLSNSEQAVFAGF